MNDPHTAAPAVRVDGLTIESDRAAEPKPLVTDVSLTIQAGEMLGLVGESGSGKSLTGSAIAGLLPQGVRPARGRVEVNGSPVELSDARQRGRDHVAMVFQNPMTSLNPSIRVGDQVAEAVRLHRPELSRREARREAVTFLGRVEIDRPAERARQYPFEFSGGMRQRVMIAIALARNPSVLIADEPTTALDVTVQQGVMDLLDRLRRELGLAVLLVSHDLALVSERCDRLLVMYAGELVEIGDPRSVLGRPLHPYVDALTRCIPERAMALGELRSLPGSVPQAGDIEAGCRFAPRCRFRVPECETRHPLLEEHVPDRHARCLRAGAGGVPGTGPDPVLVEGGIDG